MSVLLQISDPHFGTVVPAVAEALAKLSRTLAPDVLVVSGDITQRAQRDEFAAARRYLERLAVPRMLVIPGNHDIPLFNLLARAFQPFANHARAFGPELEPEIDTPDWLLIAANAVRARRHSDGELSAAQVRRVADRLRRASPRQLRVVVTHQPLHVYRASDAHNLVHGHEAAARAWSAAGADVVMGGHIHLPFVRAVRERIPDLPRPLWCVQAGTALSRRVRPGAPNSVYALRRGSPVANTHCRVERWDFNAATAAFENVDTQDLLLDHG